ncbi:MAG: DUF732 domain-containing protein [Hydrococcus sp. C42_A2020_068]|uniref:DUF732 domain-containing protein n=1 Tax=Pleurocapsa sp. PCC 7327 TaxID=118163 RepID=UPI00029FFE42|nr:DUF732 domain-containing protein [Pleurocapsa sp. PCC 7327]AFY78880.1 Protein of unknown function (DUF732) [Pleurocapsa sp. PCC 7327]MBF2020562.1 DUF732 domain-containing protein [Hydrococcus sp. C42_A2020_068]
MVLRKKATTIKQVVAGIFSLLYLGVGVNNEVLAVALQNPGEFSLILKSEEDLYINAAYNYLVKEGKLTEANLIKKTPDNQIKVGKAYCSMLSAGKTLNEVVDRYRYHIHEMKIGESREKELINLNDALLASAITYLCPEFNPSN